MRRLFRLGALGALVVAFATAVPAMLSSVPAGAVTNDVIAIGGSDTTQDFMHSLFNCQDDGTCTIPADVSNVSALYNLKVPPNMPQDVTVPGDTHCNAVTYDGGKGVNGGVGNPDSGQEWAPFGSGQGKSDLSGSIAKTWPTHVTTAYTSISGAGGCLDIARSSSGPSGSCDTSGKDPCNFEYYAFALDAVSWASPSLNAPPSLTLAQLQGIYNCSYNDWSQVGGKPGPIQRVLPQDGSGTGDFFIKTVLQHSSGLRTDFSNTGVYNGNPITCPAVIANASSTNPNIEENNGNILNDPLIQAKYQQIIIPYSSGKWVYQASHSLNPSVDKRNGLRPGGLVNPAVLPNAPVAWTVRWAKSAWQLNDGTIINGHQAAVNQAAFANTITGTGTGGSCSFQPSDVGYNVQGSFVADGTVITAVNTTTCVAQLDRFLISGSQGATYPNTTPVTVGYGVISERNPGVLTSSNVEYPGARYVYNVIQATDEPSYSQSLSLVGFDANTSSGVVSDLCQPASNPNSASGAISSNGFAPLPGLLEGANTSPVTCRLLQPTH